MKILKHQENNYRLFGYKSMLSAYGCVVAPNKRKYSIEFIPYIIKGGVKVYSGNSRPLIRLLPLLDLIFIIPFIFYLVAVSIFFTLAFIVNYPYTTLIEKSFLSDTWELLSGWLWIGLGIYGIIRIFI